MMNNNTISVSPPRPRRANRKRYRIHYFRLTLVLVATLCLIVLLFTLLGWVINVLTPHPEKLVFQYETQTCTVETGFLIILPGKPNVRSEPLASTYKETIYAGTPAGAAGFGLDVIGVESSYGRLKDYNNDGVILRVSRLLISYKDPWNGPFYGIFLEDLSEAELKLLPSKVKDDPDAIVWISEKYLETSNIVID